MRARFVVLLVVIAAVAAPGVARAADPATLTFQEFIGASDPNTPIADLAQKWLDLHSGKAQTLADVIDRARVSALAQHDESTTMQELAAASLPPEALAKEPPTNLSITTINLLDRQRVMAGLEQWFPTLDDEKAFIADHPEVLDPAKQTDGGEGRSGADPSGGSGTPADPNDGSGGDAPATGNSGGGDAPAWDVTKKEGGEETGDGAHQQFKNDDGSTTDISWLKNADGSSEAEITVTDADGNVVSDVIYDWGADGTLTETDVTSPDTPSDDGYVGGEDASGVSGGSGAIDPSVIAAHDGSVVSQPSGDTVETGGMTIYSNELFKRTGVIDPAPDGGTSGGTAGGMGSTGPQPTVTAGPECFDPNGCTTVETGGGMLDPNNRGPISLHP